MFQTKVVEKIKDIFEDRAVWEMMWTNSMEQDRPQRTIRRMRIARWLFTAFQHSAVACLNFVAP